MRVQNLPYPLLLQQLEVDTVRRLEDLIIDGVYGGLFKGKLDQEAQCFRISEAAGRDVRPNELGDIIATLQRWQQTSSHILTLIDDNVRRALPHAPPHAPATDLSG